MALHITRDKARVLKILYSKVSELDVFLDNLDKSVKRLPSMVQTGIGCCVAYGVQLMPGNAADNFRDYTMSGGEFYPGSAIKWYLHQLSSNFDYFAQPLIQRAYKYAPLVTDKISCIPDLTRQIYSYIPVMAQQFQSYHMLINKLFSFV